MNRINLAFLIFSDFITDVFYGFYNIQIYLNFSNVFFMSLALLTILKLYSIAIVVLYELPFRIILKDLFKKKSNKVTKLENLIED